MIAPEMHFALGCSANSTRHSVARPLLTAHAYVDVGSCWRRTCPLSLPFPCSTQWTS